MTMLYTGRPVPANGHRKFSPQEALQRAKAMKCLRARGNTECKGQIFVGLFFDGTGNNHKWVEDGQTKTQRQRNKHSNVARLYDAYINDPANGFYSVYMQGVGTPFAEIGDTFKLGTDYGGSGFGYMGADRINWGLTSLLNAVYNYATGADLFSAVEQRDLVNLMSMTMIQNGSAYAAPQDWTVGEWTVPGYLTTAPETVRRLAMYKKFEEKLVAAVKGSQRKVVQINVSVFGFSRGAAEARACTHWLHEMFKPVNGAFQVAGIPIRMGFLGVFDTVAAVGVGDVTPITFGHMAWAYKTQSILPAVEECAHFVALHEQRASFPLESATGWKNVGYPGMHSDVGGGYTPGDQGKSMPAWGQSPHLSQIPLIDMHFAALKAGVPLLTTQEISAKPALAASYATDARLIKAYNDWLATNGVQGGTVREFTEAHTKQYLRWRGSMQEGKGALMLQKRFYQDAPTADKKDLLEADAELGKMIRDWRERANLNLDQRMGQMTRKYARRLSPLAGVWTDASKDHLTAEEKKFYDIMCAGPMPPAASVTLFEDYVHDSRAGFRVAGKQEPVFITGGYARFRHVFLQGEGDSAVRKIGELVSRKTQEKGQEIAEDARDIKDYTVRTYDRARDRIVAGYHRVEKAASDAADRVEKAATDAAERAKREIQAKADAAKRKAVELKDKTVAEIKRDADEAQRIYDAAQKHLIKKYEQMETLWHQYVD
ncbi:T6SS phospholipase effector Tle1-like catalytic domain-containing protein [Herbaspirillum robiniae]|uniref:DUF2235 domain-containing protein n=1 Tax=Herbaspirillum robiniae TaxID=2014887 RepID=A0ABX2LZC6_9BURK|nr:DUF2235 domain-containing protein [Herbaspirillum robiniae]NUU01317.1 DUF2235 domain-containing protein [Herbaspirillum robiniae]